MKRLLDWIRENERVKLTGITLTAEELSVKISGEIKNYTDEPTFNLTFTQNRLLLENLVELQRSLKPTIVFMPSFNDLHQDHHIMAQEAMRTFKKTSILAYEMPWNNINFSTQLFIKLEKRHIDTKLRVLKEYQSQSQRAYARERFVLSLAHTRGVSIDTEYAEAFEVVRCVIK